MKHNWLNVFLLTNYKSIVVFMFLFTFFLPNFSHAYVRWDFSSNEEGWTGRNGTYAVQTSDNGGQLTVNTVGNDPGIVSPNISLSASSNNLLKMRVATFCSDKNATVYFKRSGSNTVYTGGTIYYSSGGSWGPYEIDLSGNSNWTGTITQIRIDPAGSCGSPVNTGFIAFDWIEATSAPIHDLLLSPSQNETITTRDFTLSWSDVGAQRYELYVDNNVGLGSPEISMNNIVGLQNYTQTSFSLEGIWLPQNVYYWKVIAFFSDGTSKESSKGSFTYTPPKAPAPVWVPLYRLYNSTIHDHFYTTVKDHKENAESDGYHYEKIECYLSDRPYDSPDSRPLFHLYSSGSNEHYYTSNGDEKDTLINTITGNFEYQGIVGFLNENSSEGLLPIKFAKDSINTDNFYTVSKFEYDNAVNTYGFSPMGILGYVSPSGLLEPEAHTRPQANFGGVDLGSGAYRGLNQLDLSMKGRGPSLAFAHYYNSFNFNQYPMGYGWNHNLNTSIIENIETGDVFVIWENGTVSEFLKNGTSYTDNSGNHDQLVLVDNGIDYGYHLTRKNQTVFKFGKIGSAYSYKIVLLTIEDWKGNTLTYDYEAVDAFLLSVRDEMGRKLVLDYNTSDQLVEVYEEVNGVVKRRVTFTYNTDGLVETFTDALGKVTRYDYYEEAGARQYLLKSITYPEQNNVIIDYDDSEWRRVKSIKIGDDPASTISYTPASNTTTVTDPAGNTFRFIHEDFKLTSAPDYNMDAFKYEDPLNPNLPTYIEDKEENPTYFEYDTMGNVVKITNALGKIAEYSYNNKNNITSKTDFQTVASEIPDTIYSYDTNGNRLVSVKNPENEYVMLSYDVNNQVSRVKNGRNYSTLFEYDSFGNLERIEDAEGNITFYTNDYAGRTTQVLDGENKNTSYSFDNNNHIKTITNALGHQVNMSYNDNGLLETVSWLNGSELSKTTYTYNNKDRLWTIENPLTDKVIFTYNTADNMRIRRDALGNATTYQYDSKNRLQNIAYPDHTVIFERNSNGQITSASSLEGTASIEYNTLNQVKKYAAPYGKIIQYSYNDAGRLETLTYPGGKIVEYGYDDAGRLDTVQDWIGGTTRYHYDAAGNLDRIVRPNATEALYAYDNASRLTGITEKKNDGTVIASYVYELDGVGNHKSVNATEPLHSTPLSEETTYTTDKKSNRLLSAGSISFTYDDNGNRKTSTASGGTTYSWNYENSLKSITTLSPAVTTQHLYDAFQNRISRIKGSDTKKYVLDITGQMSQVIAETDANGNIIAYYVYGLGLLSRIDVTDNRHFYHYNNRGDTVALTDGSGEITDSYVYDEYGKLLDSTGVADNPFKFVGQYGVMDEGDDLYFMRTRFYDADVGRFLSEDPIGFDGGDWNLYAYVGGNPVVGIDPMGLKENFLFWETFWKQIPKTIWDIFTRDSSKLYDAPEAAVDVVEKWAPVIQQQQTNLVRKVRFETAMDLVTSGDTVKNAIRIAYPGGVHVDMFAKDREFDVQLEGLLNALKDGEITENQIRRVMNE